MVYISSLGGFMVVWTEIKVNLQVWISFHVGFVERIVILGCQW